jgi:hypothetical protein
LEDKFLEGVKIIPLQSIHLGFEDCSDDFMFEEGLSESKEKEGYNPYGFCQWRISNVKS